MGRGKNWCILRTSGPRTLLLASSLVGVGYDAWTPKQTEKKRQPGGRRAVVTREVAITPTFVFVRADRLHDLARDRALPMSPHPNYSIFRYYGRYPLVADRDIAALREMEERAAWKAARKQPAPFVVGEDVRVAEGAAAGMSGIVETCDSQFALVAFGGMFRMKIATFLLRTDEVQDGNRLAA